MIAVLQGTNDIFNNHYSTNTPLPPSVTRSLMS